MKSRKNTNNRKKYTRRNKKGGFSFGSKPSYVAPSGDCDPNNLTSIKGSRALHENYQKCCPKGMFGTKNSSPYCKQLDLNFQAAYKAENDANEYHGYQPEQVYQMKQQEANMYPAQKKPWYKFWGGKTAMRIKKNKKQTQRRR